MSEGKKKLNQIISKDTFFTEYITNNLSLREIAKKYNLNYSQVAYLNSSQYHIEKDQSSILKNMKQTFTSKYGTDNPQKRKEIQEKTKRTNLERYGHEWSSQSDAIKEKIAATNIQKYGTKSSLSSDIIRNKSKQTMLQKYGVKNASQCKLLQDKRKETFNKKYGTDNPFQNEDVKEKIKQTNLEKYGVEYASQNKEIQDKVKQTNLQKYGVENQFQRKEVQDKIKQTSISRYGKPNWKQNPDHDIFYNKPDLIEFIEKHYNGKCTVGELSEISSYTSSSLYNIINKLELRDYIKYLWAGRSSYENEIIDYLKSLGITNIQTNNREILNGKEIDIYLPDYKIGIEINGNYWHSNLCKDSKYHFNKSLECEKHGIRLIHLYEYELLDENKFQIIKTMLALSVNKVQNKIYARNCEIRKITNKEAAPFNNVNHLQGHRDAKVTYGLYYNNTLVQLMSFSKHKKYDWEIIRGCPGSNNLIVGGVGKLFNHFIKEYHPKQVFSYCDFNKFDGKSYSAIGMKFIGYTGPDKTWLINGCHKSRSPHKYKEYKNMADAVIYGSGSKRFLWSSVEV